MKSPVSSRTAEFVTAITRALKTEDSLGGGRVLRRRLRTVTARCGHRGTRAFLLVLQAELERHGVFAEPNLADPGLQLDDWVLFSNVPFGSSDLLFGKEKHLARFVESSLGKKPFRNLVPYSDAKHTTGLEYRLPSGRRIDLLCQERTRSGMGALVVVEFKRASQRGVVEQLYAYMEEVRTMFPSRNVRGIIVSGAADDVALRLLSETRVTNIAWYTYDIQFNPVN